MKPGPYSFDEGAVGRGSLRPVAIPALIAGLLCVALLFGALKWLRPDPEPPAKWNIQWIELPDFKKPNAATKPNEK